LIGLRRDPRFRGSDRLRWSSLANHLHDRLARRVVAGRRASACGGGIGARIRASAGRRTQKPLPSQRSQGLPTASRLSFQDNSSDQAHDPPRSSKLRQKASRNAARNACLPPARWYSAKPSRILMITSTGDDAGCCCCCSSVDSEDIDSEDIVCIAPTGVFSKAIASSPFAL
jgi:hypothetical protein